MATFRRLLGFLRPYRRTVIGSLLFAWAAMGMTVLIPWLVGQHGERDRAPTTRRAILPAGAGDRRRRRSCGSGSPFVRRLIAGKVSVAVEYDLRERIYAHLQRSSSASSTPSRPGS